MKSIEYSGDQIAITDKDGNIFNAEKVIVTVPVSILKSGGITFSPSLPGAWTSSLAKFGYGQSIRVFLDFKKNFWGEDTGFIWGGITGPQYFSAGAGRSEFYRTLSITINGPKAEELSPMGRDMIPLLLAELDAVYNGDASKFIRVDSRDPNQYYYIIQDWGKEEFIKGAYSYPLPNATQDDHVNLGTPVNDKVFFAGEATDVNGDAGTVNGALSSAERVTEEVIKSIMAV